MYSYMQHTPLTYAAPIGMVTVVTEAERELGTKGKIIRNPLLLMSGQCGRCVNVTYRYLFI